MRNAISVLLLCAVVIVGCSDSSSTVNQNAANSQTNANTEKSPKVQAEVPEPQVLTFEIPDSLPMPPRFLSIGSGAHKRTGGMHYDITAQAPDIETVEKLKSYFETEFAAKGWTVEDLSRSGRTEIGFKRGEKVGGSVAVYTKPEYGGVFFMLEAFIPDDTTE